MNKNQSTSQQVSTETGQESVKSSLYKKGSDGLTDGQRKFFIEYLKDRNATQAAIRAEYAPATAASQGSRLLKNAKIQQAIQQFDAEALEKVKQDTGISLERTLTEIARLAFFDPRKLFSSDGKPLAINELDDDTAASIAGLDVLEEYEGTGKDRVFIGMTKKYKLTDKRASLDMLMKHLGGYKEDNEQGGSPSAALLVSMTPDEAYKLMLKK